MSRKNGTGLRDTCLIRLDRHSAKLLLVIRSTFETTSRSKQASLIWGSLALIWIGLIPAPVWALTPGEREEPAESAAATPSSDLTVKSELAPGSCLTSSYSLLRQENDGDARWRVGGTDLTHTLALSLGPSSHLLVNANEHQETWHQIAGPLPVERHSTSAQLQTRLGTTDLRMALTSVRTSEGEQRRSETTREIHWSATPSPVFRLTADYAAKDAEEGRQESTQSVAATLRLMPGAELGAIARSVSTEGGRTRESTLKLDASMGGGGSAAQLRVQQVLTEGPAEAVSQHALDVAVTGGLGLGEARTNLTARLHEQRAMEPGGTLARVVYLHADRAFGSRLKLTVDREERTDDAAQYVSSSRRSAAECVVEAPRGELSDWAKETSCEDQFAGAQDLPLLKDPHWGDLPFAGTRVWSKDNREGDGGELRSVGWAHRMMVGERYHVEVASETHTQAEDGGTGGPRSSLRRKLVAVSALVARPLVAQGRYIADDGDSGAQLHRQAFVFGLHGPLSEQVQLAASIARGTSPDSARSQSRASITLAYALQASDEHRVSVKGGYAWGDDCGARGRSYRLAVDFHKPI